MTDTPPGCAATRVLIQAERDATVAARLTLLRACLTSGGSPFYAAQAAREALATVQAASGGVLPPDVALRRAAALYTAVNAATQGETQ